MNEIEQVETREDFARSFVRSFRQAMTVIEKKRAGEELPPNDFEDWIENLKAEADIMRAEDAKNAD